MLIGINETATTDEYHNQRCTPGPRSEADPMEPRWTLSPRFRTSPDPVVKALRTYGANNRGSFPAAFYNLTKDTYDNNGESAYSNTDYFRMCPKDYFETGGHPMPSYQWFFQPKESDYYWKQNIANTTLLPKALLDPTVISTKAERFRYSFTQQQYPLDFKFSQEHGLDCWLVPTRGRAGKSALGQGARVDVRVG